MPPRRHSRRKMRVLSDHNAENNKVNRQCAATEGYVRLLLTKKHPTMHPKVRGGGVKNPVKYRITHTKLVMNITYYCLNY